MREFRSNLTSAGAAVTLLLALISAGCQDRQELLRVRQMAINDIDPAGIADGSYPGQFTYGKFTHVVVTTIRRGRISTIDILANRRNRYARKAEAVIPRMIEAQTPNVDAVTGATTTSKALMKAVENSLTDKPGR